MKIAQQAVITGRELGLVAAVVQLRCCSTCRYTGGSRKQAIQAKPSAFDVHGCDNCPRSGISLSIEVPTGPVDVVLATVTATIPELEMCTAAVEGKSGTFV